METMVQAPEAAPKKEMNISYETIFEILRIEKNRDDLQELPDTFFDDILAYLREKQQIIDESKAKGDIFSVTERDKASNEMMNLRRILKELYERREKKIINLAINKSRTRSNIIDTSKLMNEEKIFFDKAVSLLDMFRQGIIGNVLDFRQPFIEHNPELQPASQSSSEPEPSASLPEKSTKLVRFLHPVPRFVGQELEVYGPFEEEDMATLPLDIAEILISKGRAEEISGG